MRAEKNRRLAGALCIITLLGITACAAEEDSLIYEEEKYVLLEYNQDVLYYDYHNHNDQYFEEDVIYPVEGSQWDMVICNGDLFVIADNRKKAQEYYSDDANYEWYVTIENEVEDRTYPIVVSEEEAAYLYDVNNLEKEYSIYFDEMEIHGVIGKISKDNIINARTDMVLYEGDWYWKSEIIDEDREDDGDYPQYIQKLTETLNEKILELN